MSLRDTLRKAAELLVVLPPDAGPVEPLAAEEEPRRELAQSEVEKVYAALEVASQPPPAKTVAQIVRETEGPNLDQIKVDASAVPPPVNPDGTVNYQAIYQAASLPPAPFTAEQVLEMLAALPAELPMETKRQTVRVSINAMGKSIGATPESIVADASRKLAALTAYSDNLTKMAGEYVRAAETKIATLEAEIAQLRKAIRDAQEKQAGVTEHCAAESDRLDDVLEFFSLDVPPSRYAAPSR